MVEGREKRRKQSGVTYRRPWGSKGVQMQTPNLTIYGDTPRPCAIRGKLSHVRRFIKGRLSRGKGSERGLGVFKCTPLLQ